MLFKSAIQEKTKYRFRKTTASKQTIEGVRSHYMCSQSGVYVYQGKGKRPAPERQIYKTGKACPAHMIVTETMDRVLVTFYKTHVGHGPCPYFEPREPKKMKTDSQSSNSIVIHETMKSDLEPKDEKTLPATILREFGRAAYAPLRELLPQYSELQTQLLLQHLKDPQLDQEDLLEHSRAILTVSERCEQWLAKAHSTAKKIAGDALSPYYIPAVENFISTLASLISAHARRIETTFLSSASSGQATGVLSSSFPASLMLQTAAATILDTLAKQEFEEPKDLDPLHDLPYLLLESSERPRGPPPPLPSSATLRRSKDQLRNLARAILRNPIHVQLEKIPQLSVWNNNDALSTDLPDFALSPQEYITEIGQYLMTLPQHLEMHLSEKQAPLQYLSEVCTHTCEVYAEKILNIRNMDALGTKRCLNDIVYLSSVVEDLGSSITPALRSLEKSLRAAAPAQTD